LVLHREPKTFDEAKRLFVDVDVNGTSVTAVLDTGLSHIVSCSREEARKLQLREEKLQQPMQIAMIEGIVERDVIARDVPVSGFGKQAEGDGILEAFDEPLAIGMPFISGSTLTFYETGDWDFVFPGRKW